MFEIFHGKDILKTYNLATLGGLILSNVEINLFYALEI